MRICGCIDVSGCNGDVTGTSQSFYRIVHLTRTMTRTLVALNSMHNTLKIAQTFRHRPPEDG